MQAHYYFYGMGRYQPSSYQHQQFWQRPVTSEPLTELCLASDGQNEQNKVPTLEMHPFFLLLMIN